MSRSHEKRKCETCGAGFAPFYGRPSNRFCSRRCYLVARWGETPKNTCHSCGNDITLSGKRKQRYCSLACRIIALTGRPHPRRSGRSVRQCEVCFKTFDRPASNFHSVRVFCGRRCMAEWQSDFVRGSKHPRWKGGLARSYGVGWRGARRAALAKADGICERCKKRPVQHVHHRLPVRYFSRERDAHFSRNLIAVCHRCHAIEHRQLKRLLPLLDLIEG